jgi:hypothetical protein
MGTNPLRPPVDPVSDRVGYLREVVLLTNALTHFMRTKKGRLNDLIKPQSAMNILLGANRVLRQQHLSFIPLKALTLSLRGLMRRFVQQFGPVSLVPKRREPFSNGMIDSLTSMPEGANMGSGTVFKAGSLFALSWTAAVSVSTSAGFRKAEMFKSNAETFFLTWDLISWTIGGKLATNPTDAELSLLKEGDYVIIVPPPSKSDQFNTVWGSHPLYMAFHTKNRNAARALQQLGKALKAENRQKGMPVFVNDDRSALTSNRMASAMYAAMSRLVGAARAKLYTWHSGRIFLCTALHACNVKPSTIQAMLRWQTEESMRAYNRMSMSAYANNVDRASDAVIASVQTRNMPITEQFDFFVAMQAVTDLSEE